MTASIWLITLLLMALQMEGRGQHLEVPVVYQEKSQWCWAAVSKSVLGYYGHDLEQCEIAEYTRSVATWHEFGTSHCCTSRCDHWNYIQGTAGSIEDILLHFGNIWTDWTFRGLFREEIKVEMEGGRPFVIRWGWSQGGGHFLVIHGISGSNVCYMDPLYGSMVASYMHMVGGANHTWTSTLRMDMYTSVAEGAESRRGTNGSMHFHENLMVYPNPATGLVRVEKG